MVLVRVGWRLYEIAPPELKGKPVAPVERMREFDQRFELVGWQGLIGTAVSGLLFSIPVGGLFATDCLVSRRTKTPAL